MHASDETIFYITPQCDLSPVNRRAIAAVGVAVILITTGLAIYYYYGIERPLPPEYSWGRAGTLALNLTLERTGITPSEPLNYTVKVTNVGREKVRLHIGYHGTWTDIRDESNRTPDYYGPLAGAPPPPETVSQFNRNMKVLGPGESLSERGFYANHTVGGGYHDIQSGKSYHITAGYTCSEDRPYPALPHWLGSLETGPIYFTVQA